MGSKLTDNQLRFKCPNPKCPKGTFAVFTKTYIEQKRRLTCPHCGEEHLYETHALLKK
jgi:predicted RNA-binding Zn-ribbon protein involved in translation (DUF1610 family)